MTPSDVHAQLKVRYPGAPVPYATVKSGLAEEVVIPSSRIERDGRGMYRSRRLSSGCDRELTRAPGRHDRPHHAHTTAPTR
jgi:hypothetical protein